MKTEKTKVSKALSLLLVLTLLAASMSFLVGCGNKESPEQGPEQGTTNSEFPKMELTLSTMSQPDTAFSITSKMFMDKITQKSGGNITFKSYFNATLSKPTENLNAVSTGVADLGDISIVYTPSLLPVTNMCLIFPFAPSDPALSAKIQRQMVEKRPEFKQEYDKNNIHVLAWKGSEDYGMIATGSFTSVDSLKGKKIGAGGVYYSAWFTSIGAAPISTSAADAYQNLNNNVYSGLFVYPSIINEYKLYEVAKNFINLNMGARPAQALIINKQTYDAFPYNVKKLFDDTGLEVEAEYHEWLAQKTAEWNKNLTDNKITFSKFSDEEKKLWIDKIAENDTINMWIKDVTAKGIDGSGLVGDYIRTAETAGHKWLFDTSKYKK